VLLLALLLAACCTQPAAHAARLSNVSRTWCGVLGAALLLIALAAGGCSSSPSCANIPCPGVAPKVTFTPTINGVAAVLRKDGHVHRYRVHPGEDLVMRIAVTVPQHVTITALWFGISTGRWGSGPKGRPVGMQPILAHYNQPLSAGSHTFGVRWHVPAHRPPTSLYLTYTWSSHQPPASVSGPVAQLTPACFGLPQHQLGRLRLPSRRAAETQVSGRRRWPVTDRQDTWFTDRSGPQWARPLPRSPYIKVLRR